MSQQDLAARELLACPRCRSRLTRTDGAWTCPGPACPRGGAPFAEIAGLPALVDFDRSVLTLDGLRSTGGSSVVERSARFIRLRRLVDGENTVAPRQVDRLVSTLVTESEPARPVILVVGGGAVGSGLEWLYQRDDVDLVGFDIYASASTQFIADGHDIPIADGAVDGVLIQAVLEHVLRPEVVAAEIHRVLRPGGLVYADTPFLQQVHEAAYDFTRFTDSGHRYLFRRFERLDSGTVAGAGTALRWSIAYFVRALTRSATASRLSNLLFFWLNHVDAALDPRHSLDAASSVFFLGRKADREISAAEIIDYYRGGNRD